uniref:Protocadherin gamma-C5-like n=1 Tax=Paramormyrops kingsleyae TaxID=1676925 RepID=A0A3B3T4V9_9TELE|nr:protocadherin gamma-A4-like isoform X32 [Paramormyrops kingsleyae]
MSASFTWQVWASVFVFCCNVVCGQIRYSIPEEMKKGLLVGDVAKDLDLNVKRLVSGRARLVIDGSKQYLELHRDKGLLVVRERIDREQLCGQKSPCSFSLEIVLEEPLELYAITVEVQDINDNAPVFSKNEIRLKISESSPIGTHFLLDSALDPDVGTNTLQSYTLKPTDNFVLKQHNRPDGRKYAEMILQAPLDREKQSEHSLILTAVDGGNPQMTGTVKIQVTVLDANDNSPVFTEAVYKASIKENSMRGTLVTKVSAVDLDEGYNSNVSYSFTHADESIDKIFQLNPDTGEIKVIGEIDHEVVQQYEINIQASDPWGLTGSCKLTVEILDVNDNSPVITLPSYSAKIPEDSLPGTVIALISVQDLDTGKNGLVSLSVEKGLPFKIKSSLRNYYTLVTETVLDREKVSKYNITIIASDEGLPSLTSIKMINLEISDVNDNAPVFGQNMYSAYVMENNTPGMSVLALRATDLDWGENARILYHLINTDINGAPVSSYFSLNSDTGVIYCTNSLDYEQNKEFKIYVKAQDGGSPPLCSNVTVIIYILDQNDNAPQILYPVQPGGSLVAEMVPRSADIGYLVTKVVAIDGDSGQNAWLSYKLLKATDRPLFEIGLQNGEIRTVRQVGDKDAVKQKLTVIVEDNGQPPRSASVNVNVAVADSFPDILTEFSDFTQTKDYNDNLTFYLVLALAVVSFLFAVSITAIISLKCYRQRREKMFGGNLPVIPYYPPLYADAGGTGTLQHVYDCDVYRTTDSRRSDVKFLRPISQSLVSVEASSAEPTQRKQKTYEESSTLQKPPNTDWRFSQNQRPGPSGCSKLESAELRWTSNKRTRAGVPPEGAVGTGPWPNPPTEAEQLQALMAAANEVSEATATLGPGTMGLSTRYSPQFTLQHVPDYRQNVYIPGSTATLTANPQQQALPPPQAQAPPPTQAEAPKAAQTPASKKKSAKKEKK